MSQQEKPKTPSGGVGAWDWVQGPDVVANGIRSETWGAKARLAVCSSFGFMPEPTWHVSVSARPGTGPVSDEDLAMVRRDFGMVEAEEDNLHGAVRARHLWLVKK